MVICNNFHITINTLTFYKKNINSENLIELDNIILFLYRTNFIVFMQLNCK